MVVESRFEDYPRHMEYNCNSYPKWAIKNNINSIRGEMMITKAVIDRFDDDKAVLLVGEEEDRLVVLRSSLPEGVKEGTWLQVDVADDRILSASIDQAETAKRKEIIEEKLAKLRKGDQRKS
jgi:hypothetical protein